MIRIDKQKKNKQYNTTKLQIYVNDWFKGEKHKITISPPTMC